MELPSSVAIVAMGKTGRMDISGYEYVIGINNTHAQFDIRPDIIVAMDDLERDEKTEPDYVDAIVNAGCPVLSTRRFRKWPSVQPYPIEAITKYLENTTSLPAHKFLDNSICYATALCLFHGVKKIALCGVDLTPPYNRRGLKAAMERWKRKGYGHAPDWFSHYDRDVLVDRRPRECGWESLHFLIGFGTARWVEFEWGEDSTILNMDRQKFYYGYQKDPI